MLTRIIRDKEWFEPFYVPEPMSGCWIWVGGLIGSRKRKNPHLRAGIRWDGRTGVSASRVAYLLHRGEIPKGILVLHHCDNPVCVNPDHLYLGTHTDNLMDRIVRGPRGSRPLDRRLCVNGHAINATNTRFASYGKACRICQREASRRSKDRRKSAA